MEELVGLSFAMGVPKRKTRQQKKEEAKKALYEHVKRKQRDKNLRIIKLCRHLGIPLPVYEPEYRVIIKPKRWFLLKGYPNHVDVFMYHAGNTIHEILRTISKHIKGRHADQRYKMLRGLARENQRVRSAFGALARLWIRSRVRAGNEEDLITGVAPTHPIQRRPTVSRLRPRAFPGMLDQPWLVQSERENLHARRWTLGDPGGRQARWQRRGPAVARPVGAHRQL
jgi:hypothetical protein